MVNGDRPRADDADLVREVAAGSEAALGELYDRYVDAVHAAASRLTSDRQVAEEVVQETFLALWNRAELFDRNLGSLAAWLHTIARNRTVDRLRAAGRRPNLIPLSSAAGTDEQDGAALDRLVASGTVIGGAGVGPGPRVSWRPASCNGFSGGRSRSCPTTNGRRSSWRTARSCHSRRSPSAWDGRSAR